MKRNYIPHGSLLEKKLNSKKDDTTLLEMSKKYKTWSESCNELNSEIGYELKDKIKSLNIYKNFVDELTYRGYCKMQDKMSSSVMEEFLFYLFKDIPSIKSDVKDGLIFMGSANAYTDLSFVPKNLKDFFDVSECFYKLQKSGFYYFKVDKMYF